MGSTMDLQNVWETVMERVQEATSSVVKNRPHENFGRGHSHKATAV
jgi:hypothetical protein